MAFRFAESMEKEIMALPPAADCQKGKQAAQAVFKKILAEHDKTQKKFDADEGKRLAKGAATKRQKAIKVNTKSGKTG